MAYGARLESVLGVSPQGFESPILRQKKILVWGCGTLSRASRELRKHLVHAAEEIPVLIPSFNNGAYIENCVSQLNSLGFSRFVVLDGGSTDSRTRKALRQLGPASKVITLPDNPGPRFFFEHRPFYRALPEKFVVTDPDLEFNQALPKDFLSTLSQLTYEFSIGKVGFALSIDGPLLDDEFFMGKKWTTIRDWESQFWTRPLPNSAGVEAFDAPIDTTFALYNKRFLRRKDFFNAIRVAGPYAAKHLPWFLDNPITEDPAAEGLYSKHSNWNLRRSQEKERNAYAEALRKIESMENSVSWRITRPIRLLHSASRKTMLACRRLYSSLAPTKKNTKQ